MKTYRGYRIRREVISFGDKSGQFKQWRAYFNYHPNLSMMLCGAPTLRELKGYIDEHIASMTL